MPKFEVHLPAAGAAGLNVTLRVDADNWMAALKTGLQKLGEQGTSTQNVLVDIQEDNSIHVTDSDSGRVFSIRELSEEEAAAAAIKGSPAVPKVSAPKPEPESPSPAAPPPSAVPSFSQLVPELPRTDPGSPAFEPAEPAVEPDMRRTLIETHPPRAAAPPEARTIIEPPRPVPRLEPQRAPGVVPPGAPRGRPNRHLEPNFVVELERPTRPSLTPIGRQQKKDPKAEIEDVLAEVFERVQEVYSKRDEESALYFLLDLALEKIPTESGSVYRADAGTGDLTFLAARGPKAEELLRSKLVVPAGSGIAGFCAMEGVSVAVSDVEKDPRFYSLISEKLSYETKSILCAPMMTHGRTFGAMQLLNRRGGHTFGAHEVGILAYVAHQAALYLNSRI